MKIENLYELLGLTNTDEALVSAIAAHGGNVADLSPKNIRDLGTDYVEISDKGVSLAFQPTRDESRRRIDGLRETGPYRRGR